MAEKLTFHFEGSLADGHRMNFYESARFQYAAARLLVKLAQFRSKGTFVKKISSRSNVSIELVTQTDGSFNINVEDAGQSTDERQFVKIPLTDMIAYVAERIVEKIDQSEIKETLIAIGKSVKDNDGDDGEMKSVDEAIEDLLNNDALFSSLAQDGKDLVRRRIAEANRERRLLENETAIAKIDFESGQKLVAMAAPLLSEMAQVALRKSATSFQIISSNKKSKRSVLFLNKRMAQEIETSLVDQNATMLLGDVFQFNKDNGWGKIKIEEGLKTLNFSIPYDKLPELKQNLIESMNKDLVYLETFPVRDRSNEILRLVVVAIHPTPES